MTPVSPAAEVLAIGHALGVVAVGALLLAATVMRIGGAADAADAVVQLPEVTPAGMEDVVVALRPGRRAPRVPDDPAVVAAVDAARGMLAANATLQAGLQQQVHDVRTSRRRLVEVADVERRRLERRLSEGTAAGLSELEATVTALAGTLDGDAGALARRVLDELAALREDLDHLGRGLHPRLLVEGGLPASLQDLARRAVLPTEVVVPDGRFPETAETTAWYVCAEAAANVAKHAGATAMRIEVAVDGDRLVMTVTDDGAGGASTVAGGGLAGLVDRLAAVGGALEVGDGAAGGTRLRAMVPLA